MMRKWSFPEELVTVTAALLTPLQVISGQKRVLTLTVAAGSAAAERLFRAEDGQAASPEASEIPESVIMLARERNLDVQALMAFLDKRGEAVRAFAETFLDDL